MTSEADTRRMTGDSDEILTTREAAEIAGMWFDAVRKMCREGRVPHRKIGGRYYVTRREAERLRDAPPGGTPC